jgi:hypothetical protein
MKRSLPYLVMTVTMMVGGYLLASFANDLSQMSLRAYGTRGQTIFGGPVIWVAAAFPQIRALSVALPVLLFIAWRMRWMTDATCLLYFATWRFSILTWTLAVAYFSFQPGILG